MEDHAWAAIHPAAIATTGGHALKEAAALGGPAQEQVSGRICSPWGTHTGPVCPWRAVPHEEDQHWSSSWRVGEQYYSCSSNLFWRQSQYNSKPQTAKGAVWAKREKFYTSLLQKILTCICLSFITSKKLLYCLNITWAWFPTLLNYKR